jgi:hypothetical protein
MCFSHWAIIKDVHSLLAALLTPYIDHCLQCVDCCVVDFDILRYNAAVCAFVKMVHLKIVKLLQFLLNSKIFLIANICSFCIYT